MFKLKEEELLSLANLTSREMYKLGSEEDIKYWFELHGKLVAMVAEIRNSQEKKTYFRDCKDERLFNK